MYRSFMTLALTFDPASQCTVGFYGFDPPFDLINDDVDLLFDIQRESDQIGDPMLMPALFYNTWIKLIKFENNRNRNELREVQEQTGLMGEIFNSSTTSAEVVNFDSMHRTLVEVHEYQTNGNVSFLGCLGPATMKAIDRIEEYYKNQTAGFKYNCTEVKQYVELMQLCASTEMQEHQRTLEKIPMYLQVVSLKWRKLLTSSLPCKPHTNIKTAI